MKVKEPDYLEANEFHPPKQLSNSANKNVNVGYLPHPFPARLVQMKTSELFVMFFG